MTGLIAGLGLSSVGASAASATGRWYWSEGYAATRIVERYDDVLEASCDGRGRRIPSDGVRRRWLYRRFECTLTTDFGDARWGLRVKGKRAFRLIFRMPDWM